MPADGGLHACCLAACVQLFDEHDAAEPLVMCVDDDEVNHIVLEGMLQSQNYRWAQQAAF